MKDVSKKNNISLHISSRNNRRCLADCVPHKKGRWVSKNALNFIWRYYIKKLREYTQPIRKDPNALILKTDCDNETQSHPMRGGIVGNVPIRGKYILLETNPAKVKIARNLGYSAVKGDIRRMPFEPLQFDMMFDFSTIDHIPPGDARAALKEYHRVLKRGGLLYLVAWCSHECSYHEPEAKQYYFEYFGLRKKIKKYFKIQDSEVLYSCSDMLFLTTFLCKRKTSLSK